MTIFPIFVTVEAVLKAHPLELHFLLFIVSLFLVNLGMPLIIRFATAKKLYDLPHELRKRQNHHEISKLGGIAVITAFVLSCGIFIQPSLIPQLPLLMAAGLVLFIAGLTDDIMGLGAFKKLFSQIFAAILITVFADLRLESLYGLLGIYELSYSVSVSFSIFILVGLINAFNLIDGVDGLVGSLTVIVASSFGVFFFLMGEIGWSLVSVAMVGCVTGFLVFNITPAKIYMGDTGAMVIGMLSGVMAFVFIDRASSLDPSVLSLPAAPALAAAILFIPVFDTIRVFLLRIYKRKSPFLADRNHIHHLLLKLNLKHLQVTAILSFVNVAIILVVLTYQYQGNPKLFLFLATIPTALFGLLYFWQAQPKPVQAGLVKAVEPLPVNDKNPEQKPAEPVSFSPRYLTEVMLEDISKN